MELPLSAPTVANWLQVRLPPGNVSVVVYVRYADSASTSPLGLPAGARLQAPVLHMQPLLLYPSFVVWPLLQQQSASGRRLMGSQAPGEDQPATGMQPLGLLAFIHYASGWDSPVGHAPAGCWSWYLVVQLQQH